MLETSNLVRKYTHISSFRKYTFQRQGVLNFPDESIYFAQIVVPLLKVIVCELC